MFGHGVIALLPLFFLINVGKSHLSVEQDMKFQDSWCEFVVSIALLGFENGTTVGIALIKYENSVNETSTMSNNNNRIIEELMIQKRWSFIIQNEMQIFYRNEVEHCSIYLDIKHRDHHHHGVTYFPI